MATVTITIVGVRPEHEARLRTIIKGELTRFGSNVSVKVDGQEPAAPKPKGK